jgi:hypothetical protein
MRTYIHSPPTACSWGHPCAATDHDTVMNVLCIRSNRLRANVVVQHVVLPPASTSPAPSSPSHARDAPDSWTQEAFNSPHDSSLHVTDQEYMLQHMQKADPRESWGLQSPLEKKTLKGEPTRKGRSPQHVSISQFRPRKQGASAFRSPHAAASQGSPTVELTCEPSGLLPPRQIKTPEHSPQHASISQNALHERGHAGRGSTPATTSHASNRPLPARISSRMSKLRSPSSRLKLLSSPASRSTSLARDETATSALQLDAEAVVSSPYRDSHAQDTSSASPFQIRQRSSMSSRRRYASEPAVSPAVWKTAGMQEVLEHEQKAPYDASEAPPAHNNDSRVQPSASSRRLQAASHALPPGRQSATPQPESSWTPLNKSPLNSSLRPSPRAYTTSSSRMNGRLVSPSAAEREPSLAPRSGRGQDSTAAHRSDGAETRTRWSLPPSSPREADKIM